MASGDARPTPTGWRNPAVETVVRVTATTAILAMLYAILPLDHPSGATAWVLLVAGLAVFGLVLTWQVRAIVVSPYPRLRAIEAVVIAVPLLIVVFASVYVAMSHAQPGSFSEAIDRPSGIYFCVIVLATVGFGDIVPRSDPARMIVTAHILLNLVLLGAGARLIVRIVQENVARRSSP